MELTLLVTFKCRLCEKTYQQVPKVLHGIKVCDTCNNQIKTCEYADKFENEVMIDNKGDDEL